MFFILREFFSSRIARRVGFAVLFFLFIFGGAFVRERGFSAFTEPAHFLANMSSSFSSFFKDGEKIMEIPPREEKISPSVCAFEEKNGGKENGVRLNEIAWMGAKENYNAEWIELKNISDEEKDISFFQLVERTGKIHALIPAETRIPRGGYFLLSRNKEYSGALNNTGNSLRLFDASCVLVDEVLAENGWPAGDNKTKQTMERGKDGKWHSSVSSGGTPNAENSTEGKLPPKRQESGSINVKSEEKIQPPKENRLPVGNEIVVTYPPILVNEIFVGGEGENANEYIELFNPNTEAFSLTGWSIKKRSSSGGFSSLVSASRLQGKSIAPKSYFLIGNEGGYTGSPLLDAGWAKSNTLAYAQNSIVLLSPLGEQVLEVVWNEIPKGKSFSLNQEGIFQVSEKTPKAENK
jgi:hypothetical protein